MTLPLDPFGRSAMPSGFTREDRVRLIHQAAEALLAGRLPDPAARLFLAGALRAWLENGGRIGELERTYLRVAAPRRSTMTPSRVWARDCSTRRATDDQAGGTMGHLDHSGAREDESDR